MNIITNKELVEILVNNEEARTLVFNSFKLLRFLPLNSPLIDIREDESFLTLKTKEKGKISAAENAEKESQRNLKIQAIRRLWLDELKTNLRIGNGNKETFIKRLDGFLKEFPKYTLDDIKAAAINYIQDCNAYNRIAKFPEYFILAQNSKNFKEGTLYNWLNNDQTYTDYTTNL